MDFLLSKYGLIFTEFDSIDRGGAVSVNIRPYLLSEMSITVLLYSWTIHERYMCSNLWSRVQNTNAFSYALLWRVMYSSQFYCLTSRYFGALSILTGEYGLTISGHVTVIRQWPLVKNTDYIIIMFIPWFNFWACI